MTDQQAKSGSHPIDRWIPWMFVAFFVVVAAVNAVFLTVANSSHSGVIVKDAYKRGVAYNEVIAGAEEQAVLGWTVNIQQLSGGQLEIKAADRDGNDLSGARIEAEALRPAADGLDHRLEFDELEPGRYIASPNWPSSGQWLIRGELVWQATPFRFQTTIILPTR